MKDNRRAKTREKYPYFTVIYNCPGCGAEARSTDTKEMNELFLKNIRGTFCPDCTKKRKIMKRIEDTPECEYDCDTRECLATGCERFGICTFTSHR